MLKDMILTDFKQKNMKLLVYTIATLSALVSCGISKDKIETNTLNAKLTFETHAPYCGGAAPTPEMEKGRRSPIPNQNFYFLLKGQDKIKASTNENGILSIDLEKGNYLIYSSDKIELSYDEFYNKFKPKNKFEVEKDAPCFKDWYAEADFELNLISDTIVTFTTKKRCYTGTNKCINYKGPIAP